MQIQNNIFLVAGGGSGLGAATASMLIANGGRVVIADVNPAGAGVAQTLGDNARFIRADVTDGPSTEAAVDL